MNPVSVRVRWSAAAILVLAGLGAAAADGSPGAKTLIEFGWDEPDPALMRQHAPELERTPFDGCVFHIGYKLAAGGQGSFTWECWGARKFTPADLAPALNDLKAARFHRFTHNFLRFNTTPAKLDWFDDYSAVVSNARLAAATAKAGKCAGILFDIEQYEGPLFDYRRQRDAGTKSWEVYAAQARRRGREVMEAFQQGFPRATIFLTFGYSLPWRQSGDGKKALAECHYGLLAPFLDGMLEQARPPVRVVDGHELSYAFKDAREYDQAYERMRTGVLPIVIDPQRYARFFQFGFGIWLDKDWRKNGWSEQDFTKNYFTPATFEQSVRAALQRTDQYVWVYSETPRWWSADGKAVKLPEAYLEALRRARR